MCNWVPRVQNNRYGDLSNMATETCWWLSCGQSVISSCTSPLCSTRNSVRQLGPPLADTSNGFRDWPSILTDQFAGVDARSRKVGATSIFNTISCIKQATVLIHYNNIRVPIIKSYLHKNYEKFVFSRSYDAQIFLRCFRS